MKLFTLLATACLAAGTTHGATGSLYINGKSDTTYDGGSYTRLNMVNCRNVTVKNCTFTPPDGIGITVNGCEACTVENCEADGGGEACNGVNVTGTSHHIVFRDCDIHNFADDGFQLRGTDLHCITIEGCRIHKLLGKGTDGLIDGPCYNGHSDGIETANTDSVWIIGNMVYDIANTSCLIVGYDTNMKIHNNIFYPVHCLPAVYHHHQNNTEFYHNTMWGAKYVGLAIGTDVQNLKVRNNIIQKLNFDTMGGTYIPSQMDIDYNLISQPGTGYTLAAHDVLFPAQSFENVPNSYVSDRPADVTAEDFSLLATCPGIDAGEPGLGITTDILGNPRDAQPDMGAIEFQAVGTMDEVPGPEALFTEVPYPNPMRSSVTFPLNGQIRRIDKKVEIRDRSGAVVQTWRSGRALACFTWDGKDTQGRNVAPGLYYYTLNIDGNISSGSILKTE